MNHKQHEDSATEWRNLYQQFFIPSEDEGQRPFKMLSFYDETQPVMASDSSASLESNSAELE